MTKKKRTRTVQRELVRTNDKLAEARAKLAALEPGGSAERPEIVDSASQIEIRAQALTCHRCEARSKVREHRVVHTSAGPIREVELACPRCASVRLHYYRVGPILN